jgi:hypothetical protein
MKSEDFGARDSGTVENVAWHHRYFFSASAADLELQYRRFRTVGIAVRLQPIERTGTPQLSKVIGVSTSRSQSAANPNATTLAARCVRETAPILARTFFR